MPFTELLSVNSTNNYALARAHAGLTQHGEAFFAHEQVAGKGQMGKVWTSGKKENIILSIVANPHPLQLAQQFQLSAAVAVGVYNLFIRYAGDDTKIKWPNDLYWQDRKAGGILIESIVGKDESGVGSKESGVWKWAVIGIGININQTSFPETLINPVSLKQITGKNFDLIELAKELCASINDRFSELMNKGFESIYEQYISNLYKRNETVKLKKGSRVFEATIKTVSTSGRLVVQHSIEEEFDFGEIEWVK
jgi:BirA family transcriptional regulator, biotin operon repressor / biotin---[acetyl-CoA-carboxylase] ligase